MSIGTQITVHYFSKAAFGVHMKLDLDIKNHAIKGQVYKEIVGKRPFRGNFPINPL